jgi:phosphatidylserine decarboxylase
MSHTEATLNARYRRLFGHRAGYLPRDRSWLHEWQRSLKSAAAEQVARGEDVSSKAVAELKKLLDTDPIVRMYVSQMIEQVPDAHKTVHGVDELLVQLDRITVTAPLYNADPARRNAFPMSALFVYMMFTPAGEAVFRNERFNRAIKNILQEWCRYLDSPTSAHVLNEGEYGWLSPFAYQDYKLYEFVTDRHQPHWGWTSYNDFFHRAIKPAMRPVAAPSDPRVIVAANDGNVVTIARGVQRHDRFWAKDERFSLADMLDRSAYVDRFVGGYVFQSFLSGANYHRWHAPISGIVREARIVDGLLFSEAESAGFESSAGVLSEGYDACVNTRGLVFIESPDPALGMVCVVPIGMTEISSVTIKVKAGDKLAKGDELGYFSYGGSSLCLVFQPGSIDHFTVPAPPPLPVVDPTSGPAIQVNAQIAIAHTSGSPQPR